MVKIVLLGQPHEGVRGQNWKNEVKESNPAATIRAIISLNPFPILSFHKILHLKKKFHSLEEFECHQVNPRRR